MFLDSDLTRSFIFDPSSRAPVRNRYFSMGMNNGNFPLEISSRSINSSFSLNLQNANILSMIYFSLLFIFVIKLYYLYLIFILTSSKENIKIRWKRNAINIENEINLFSHRSDL